MTDQIDTSTEQDELSQHASDCGCSICNIRDAENDDDTQGHVTFENGYDTPFDDHMDDPDLAYQHEPDGVIDFGATPHNSFTTGSGNQNIDGVLRGREWIDHELTYSFPSVSSDYSSGYPDDDAATPDILATFAAFDAKQEASAEYWIDLYAAVAGLSFVELDGAPGALDEDQEATIRFANSQDPSTAYGYYPNSTETGGDLWFGTGAGDDPDLGDYDWHTIGHELGHGLGLSHGHTSDGGFGAMNANRDSMEFSIMTYRSYENDPLIGGYSNANDGYAQTLMMYDIAAIQFMYGANYSYNAGTTTYTVDMTTGEMFIDGVSQGDPLGDTIFRTVWDGGGSNDHYDFSNLSNNLDIDLRPGFWVDLDVGGNDSRANLGDGNWSRGHIFNALTFGGSNASLIENASGGSGGDDIIGNDASNDLWGNGGNDDIYGGEAVDYLYGGDGIDWLYGGNGNDYLYGFDSTGGGAAGSNDTDRYYGGAGNDYHYGGIGIDYMYGGDGNDVFYGNEGNDGIYGGAGASDLVSYYYASGAVTVNLATGTSSGPDGSDTLSSIERVGGSQLYSDSLTGDANNNSLYGYGGDDSLYGADGNDLAYAGSGNDEVYGGAGDDTLYGYGGDDTIYGGTGNDQVYGGDDDDTLYAGTGTDELYGGAGNDWMSIDNGSSGDIIDGGTGIDTADFSYSSSNWIIDLVAETADYGTGPVITIRNTEHIVGASGNDTITGDAFNNLIEGGNGNDIIDGGAGVDGAVYENASGAVVVDLGTGVATGQGTDTLSNIEQVYGSDFGDTMRSSTAGIQTLFGGDGDDTFERNHSTSASYAHGWFGGAGTDTLVTTGLGGSHTIDLAAGYLKFGSDNRDSLSSIENVTVNSAADIIGSSAANDLIGYGVHNNSFYGGSGNDRLYGNGGNDELFGGSGTDEIYAGDGNDVIEGGFAADLIYGGNGDDTIRILDGEWVDEVYGGGGVDTIDMSNVTDDITADMDAGTYTTSLASEPGSTFATVEVFIAGSGDDDLTSGGFGEIYGGAGNDYVRAGLGANETLDGGAGIDTLDTTHFSGNYSVNLTTGATNFPPELFTNFENLIMGDGDDTLTGTTGNNELFGGAGDDTLIGLAGDDLLNGGDGTDTADYSVAAGPVSVNLAAGTADDGEGGTDTLVSIERVVGSNFSDTMESSNAGPQTFEGGSGGDIFVRNHGTSSGWMHVWNGGAGNDLLQSTGLSSGHTIDLAAGFIYFGVTAREELISIENVEINSAASVVGDGNANIITANGAFDNVIYGGDGAGTDEIYAGDGNDTIYGGGGVDLTYGGDGDDLFIIARTQWVDELYGGAGIDTLDMSGHFSAVTFNNLTGTYTTSYATEVGNTHSGIENFIGSDHDDDITSNGFGEYYGGGGNDYMRTGLGSFETLDGGDGIDTLDTTSFSSDYVVNLATGATNYPPELFTNFENLISGDGNDTLTGTDGDNEIDGGAGNDTIDGGDGDDRLTGGEGDDQIDGGEGSNTAFFAGNIADYTIVEAGNSVTVTDNVGTDGTDTLTRVRFLEFADGTIDAFASLSLIGTPNVDTLTGAGGDDQIEGREDNDRLYGENGFDTILGEAGEDRIYGGSGHDMINGGSDYDLIFGGLGDDQIEGEHGQDRILGDGGDDTIYGGLSNDNINGNDGDDTIYGGDQNDILVGDAGNDELHGDDGIDTLRGRTGNDTLYGGLGNDNLTGEEGEDTIFGGDGDDDIKGNDGNDIAHGDAGVDTIDGGLGDDDVYGGAGNDRLFGNDGNDMIYGGAGDELVYAGAGEDRIEGGAGEDFLLGGADNDLLFGDEDDDALVGNDGDDTLYGGDGFDRLRGHLGNDTLYGGLIGDSLTGEAGNDMLYGEEGDDNIKGNDGDDIAWGGVGADAIDGGADNDVLYGGDDNDNLFGVSGNDALYGGLGDDRLYAGLQDDFLDGGEGNDILRGDFGDDTFMASLGDDLILGDDGFDLVDYSNGTAGLNVTLNAGGSTQFIAGAGLGTHRITSIEALKTSDFNSTVVGNELDNWFKGGLGDDSLSGGLGDDTLVISKGSDTYDGGDGFDRIFTDGLSFTNTLAAANGFASNWEWLDVEGSGGTSVLTIDAAADIGVSNSGNELVFTGDAGDQAVLTGTGLVAGASGVDHLGDGRLFDSYTDGTYTLWAEQDITVVI